MVRTETITLYVDGTAMQAFTARPDHSSDCPGVVVGFELFGLTGHIRSVCERIARLGYGVIAPDFYHRTAPGIELEATDEGRQHGFELLRQLSRKQAIADVAAAMDHLQAQGITRIGMVGFSVGGHVAYLAASQLDLAAAAVFYPTFLTTTDFPIGQPEPTIGLTADIAERDGYILCLVGENDRLITQEQRQQISDSLISAHVRHEMVVYPDTPHGFFCDERESYMRATAQAAWDKVRQMLKYELQVQKTQS